MSNYGLQFSFGVDDGELDGLRKNECFVLGYELAIVREVYCKLPEGGSWPVHAANNDRICRAVRDADRCYKMHYMANDPSESRMQLTILPK